VYTVRSSKIPIFESRAVTYEWNESLQVLVKNETPLPLTVTAIKIPTKILVEYIITKKK
jgi:hypothetical protein